MDLTTVNAQVSCYIIEMTGFLNFKLPYNQKIVDNGIKLMEQLSTEEFNSKVNEVNSWVEITIQIGKATCAPLGVLL